MFSKHFKVKKGHIEYGAKIYFPYSSLKSVKVNICNVSAAWY